MRARRASLQKDLRVFVALCAALAIQCGSGGAGTNDAPETDSGSVDASAVDAAALDTGEASAAEEIASPETSDFDGEDAAKTPTQDAQAPTDADIEAAVDARLDAPAPICDPNAAPLPNEGLPEQAGTAGCPPGMTLVDTFCVDRYEASLRLTDPDGGHASWSPFVNPGTNAVMAVSISGAIPQAYIDQRQAGAACLAAGKRLCTDTEWLRACRGPTDRTYPYGDVRQPGTCNDARAVNPVVDYFGTNDAAIFSQVDNACIDQQPSSLERSGLRPACVTAEGAYDMMGNLHEWTADPAGTFRGGYYGDTTLNGNGCLYVTTAHDTAHWDYSTGFRCCADP